MRNSQAIGRGRLRGLAEALAETAEDMQAERARMNRLAGADARPVVVSSFNLFPTPPEIANRMAEAFDGFGTVLEPSAGTGRLYEAVRRIDAQCDIDLIDISAECCEVLRRMKRARSLDERTDIRQADFLTVPVLPIYDAVIMNPPFKNGQDVKHIRHARAFLRPGGRLVALCANGPRQREHLRPIADEWFDLPAGSFRSEGTGVDVAMIVINA